MKLKSITLSEAEFRYIEEVNFHNNKLLYIIINIVSILSFPVAYAVLFYFTNIFIINKPVSIFYYFISFSRMPNIDLLLFLVLLIFMMTIHELIHGLFFYLFTGEKPVFGFKNLSAYAGVPNRYIKKNYYLIACLSPLIILTIAGLVIFFIAENTFAAVMFIIISAHAAGCIGDIWVSIKLINKPAETFVNDDGMVIRIGNEFIS